MGSGRSRSSSGPIAPPVLRCCHGAGWSSEPLLGSTATAAWPRTLRPQSAAAKPGSIWLRSNCLRGGSPELQLIELLRRSRTTFPIPSQALRQALARMTRLSSAPRRRAPHDRRCDQQLLRPAPWAHIPGFLVHDRGHLCLVGELLGECFLAVGVPVLLGAEIHATANERVGVEIDQVAIDGFGHKF